LTLFSSRAIAISAREAFSNNSVWAIGRAGAIVVIDSLFKITNNLGDELLLALLFLLDVAF
jgi:hypothetical protein